MSAEIEKALVEIDGRTALKLQNAGISFRIIPPGTNYESIRFGVWIGTEVYNDAPETNVWQANTTYLVLSKQPFYKCMLTGAHEVPDMVMGFNSAWLSENLAYYSTNWPNFYYWMAEQTSAYSRTYNYDGPMYPVVIEPSPNGTHNFIAYELNPIWGSIFHHIAQTVKTGYEFNYPDDNFYDVESAFSKFVFGNTPGDHYPFYCFYTSLGWSWFMPDWQPLVRRFPFPYFNIINFGMRPLYVYKVMVLEISKQ